MTNDRDETPGQAMEEAALALEQQLRVIGWIVSQEAMRGLPAGTVVWSASSGVLERTESGDSWIATGSSMPLESHEIALPCQVLEPCRNMRVIGVGFTGAPGSEGEADRLTPEEAVALAAAGGWISVPPAEDASS